LFCGVFKSSNVKQLCQGCDGLLGKQTLWVGKPQFERKKKSLDYFHADCFFAQPLLNFTGNELAFKGYEKLEQSWQDNLKRLIQEFKGIENFPLAKKPKLDAIAELSSDSDDDDDDLIMTKVESSDGIVELIPPRRSTSKSSSQSTLLSTPASRSSSSHSILDKSQDDLYESQNREFWALRDDLKTNVPLAKQRDLLAANDQKVPPNTYVLDSLTDCMMFGALKPCPECQGSLRYSKGSAAYICTGNMSEYTCCQHASIDPERVEFVIPEARKFHNIPMLATYYGTVRRRHFPYVPAANNERFATAAASQAGTSQINVEVSRRMKMVVLKDCSFVLAGEFPIARSIIKDKIVSLGGEVVGTVSSTTVALITTHHLISSEKDNAVVAARIQRIPALSYDVFDAILSGTSFDQAVTYYNIAKWKVSDVKEKINARRREKASREEMEFGASHKPKVTVKVKSGTVVDPESGVEKSTHVYKDPSCDDPALAIHSAMLNKVNIDFDKNSFYKLQLLEHDKQKKYYVFRAWGRIGSTIGGTKLSPFHTFDAALEEFSQIYLERTGNEWSNRANFIRNPRKYCPVDIDYGASTSSSETKLTGDSLLPSSVQNIIKMIFDIQTMKSDLKEFELDLNKMPLGKLTRKQIDKAFAVLSELQQILNSCKSRNKIVDLSNKFYALIPHDVGMRELPLIDNEVSLKSKCAMMDALVEIDIAYNLLHGTQGGGQASIDACYMRLCTDIRPMDKACPTYKMLKDYVKNTHGETHSSFSIHVQEIFNIDRNGESERFEEFANLGNRMLLWHGSRVTNFAGILSQGLRIAPPEAPVTGYMFDKGLYFADMVSKSAQYCHAQSREDNFGLLLLCDVALGKMNLLKAANPHASKLPKGYQSVLGVGQTTPDSSMSVFHEDCQVPLGLPVSATLFPKTELSLLYNEYIVYNVAQVKIKYMLLCKMPPKRF